MYHDDNIRNKLIENIDKTVDECLFLGAEVIADNILAEFDVIMKYLNNHYCGTWLCGNCDLIPQCQDKNASHFRCFRLHIESPY